jgi:hypothetical protein
VADPEQVTQAGSQGKVIELFVPSSKKPSIGSHNEVFGSSCLLSEELQEEQVSAESHVKHAYKQDPQVWQVSDPHV